MSKQTAQVHRHAMTTRVVFYSALFGTNMFVQDVTRALLLSDHNCDVTICMPKGYTKFYLTRIGQTHKYDELDFGNKKTLAFRQMSHQQVLSASG